MSGKIIKIPRHTGLGLQKAPTVDGTVEWHCFVKFMQQRISGNYGLKIAPHFKV